MQPSPLHPLLAGRRSTRAFDPGFVLADATLTALLEAARWAPSAMNSQPWRFVVGRRGDATFDALVGTLVESNRTWAPNASALVLVLTVGELDGRALGHARYDTGQAVAHLTVQAAAEGLVVRQMGGFDAAAATASLGVDPALTPMVVVAIGRHDPDVELPPAVAEKEAAPRSRRAVSELVLDVTPRSSAA